MAGVGGEIGREYEGVSFLPVLCDPEGRTQLITTALIC